MALNSTFVASELVDWLHDRPRFGKTNDITTVDWTNVDSDDVENEPYIQGVAYLFFAFLALAILTTLIVCLASCCACCKCCCYKTRQSSPSLDAKDDGKPKSRCRCVHCACCTVFV